MVYYHVGYYDCCIDWKSCDVRVHRKCGENDFISTGIDLLRID